MRRNRPLLVLGLTALIGAATLAVPAQAARRSFHSEAIRTVAVDEQPGGSWLARAWSWMVALFAGDNGGIVPSPPPHP